VPHFHASFEATKGLIALTQPTILIAEDHHEIRDMVALYLEREGFLCVAVEDGFQALERVGRQAFDLIILDVMMPGIDGFDVLRTIRQHSAVPVIMLTAKQEEVDRLAGFDLGADDYVGKPFSVKELVRRVQAVLKRASTTAPAPSTAVLQHGAITLVLEEMRVLVDGDEVVLTAAEFQLLRVFMEHREQVLAREQLMTLAFGDDYDGLDRNVDSHIKRIRQKIERDPSNPDYLHTKYGAGYVFGGRRK
jgi:DNA-binding response OmpR family regulator